MKKNTSTNLNNIAIFLTILSNQDENFETYVTFCKRHMSDLTVKFRCLPGVYIAFENMPMTMMQKENPIKKLKWAFVDVNKVSYAFKILHNSLVG